MSRDDVVPPLLALAASASYSDRADAGGALAVFADLPATHRALAALLLDQHDTYVTLVTAEALLHRHDSHGYALLASAFQNANDNQSDWLHTALDNVLGIYAKERDEALALCGPLPDAGAIVAALHALDPILWPES
ncbi:hypothetical protein ACFPM7_14015 [Actinokineospora guangxiensis]|uniref:Uncharacterized protein n=1 Tax=Actinokineospora guangxiensis TaxID=1490288 RepID=A0ABW0EQK2_9PSEU